MTADVIIETRLRIFLRALAEDGNTSRALRVAGVDRKVVKNARENDLSFAADYENALAEAVDRIEAEAVRRGVDGVPKKLWHQGLPVYEYRTVVDENGQPVKGEGDRDLRELVRDEHGQPVQAVEHNYSDALLNTLLKGNLPWKYRDNVSVTGAGGGPIEIADATPLEAARKVAYVLALGMRAKLSQQPQEALPEPFDDGSDLA